MKDLLPGDAADLHDASAAGWAGLTLVEHAGGATLVVSASAAVLAARDGLWLNMTLEPSDRPRLLRVRLLLSRHRDADPTPWARGGASLDLAYPEGRALLERVARRGILWVVFLEAGSGHVVTVEHIHLDAAVEFLRAAAARAAEWHPVALAPPELTVPQWRAASRRAPCLAAGGEGGATVLVVPQDVLAGLEHSGGELIVRPAGAGGARRRPDLLELVLAWGRHPRAVVVDVGAPDQRELARRLSGQIELVVLATGRQARTVTRPMTWVHRAFTGSTPA